MSVPPLFILIAEDNRVNQLFMKTLLEREGHSISLANNGREAYELFQSKDFDLILMDVQMPDIDGLEAIEIIRRIEKEKALRPTPIFALSAYDDMQNNNQYRTAEIDRFLLKPLDTETIQKAIEDFFGEPEEPGESEAAETGVKKKEEKPEMEIDRNTYQKELLEEYAHAEETLRSMIEIALKDIPVAMTNIEETFRSGDARNAAREAHSLANIAGVLHRPQERDTALIIEEKIEQGEISSAGQYILELKNQIRHLTATLHTILTSSLAE